MTSSLPACAPDRTSRGDNLLRAFGFVFRKTLILCGLLLVLELWDPIQCSLSFPMVGLFFFTTSAAAGFAQNTRLCLPIGNRRTSVFLWWWRVPMTPLVALFAGALKALWNGAPAFWDSAQHTLWAAGILAVLSLVQTLLSGNRPLTLWIRGVLWIGVASLFGNRPLTLWIRGVLWIGVASLFVLYARSSSPVAAAVASGKYDLALTLVSALLVPLSCWALRFSSREDLLRDMPMTPQVAARELDQGGGGWARVFSALDGAIPVKRASRHWLAQLLARCLFSYQSLFTLTAYLLVHYAFACSAWRRDFIYSLITVFALETFQLVDPLLFRRLPVSALTLTSVTAGIVLSTVGFLLVPTLAFQRIPGRFEVEFFFSNLLSFQTLGIFWARAALVMGYWTLRISLRGRLSMSDSGRGHGGWDSEVALLLVAAGDPVFAEFYKDFGWRSDVLLGSVLMFGSMALYYGMIRRGDRIYRFAHRTRGARAA